MDQAEAEVLETPAEEVEPETNVAEVTKEPAPEESDEVVVTIGEESPPSEEDEIAKAPEWVRELRKSNREKDRRIRELEQAQAKPVSTAPAIGTKPTLESSGYDEEKFERDLTAYHERKRAADAAETKKAEEAKKQNDAWQESLANHEKLKAALKVSDYDDAETELQTIFDTTQRALVIDAAKDSALLSYALGKNPAKAKELASIKNPVKFVAAVVRLETELKVTPRKTAPLPEKKLSGSAPVSTAMDNQLARLEAEADKTGDRTKVIAYRREKRRAA